MSVPNEEEVEHGSDWNGNWVGAWCLIIGFEFYACNA